MFAIHLSNQNERETAGPTGAARNLSAKSRSGRSEGPKTGHFETKLVLIQNERKVSFF